MSLTSLIAKLNGDELYDLSDRDKFDEAITDRRKYTDSVVDIIKKTEKKIYTVWGEGEAPKEVIDAFAESIEKGVEITIATYMLRNETLRKWVKEGKIIVMKTPEREEFHTTVCDERAYVNEYHPEPNNRIRKVVVNKKDVYGASKNLKKMLQVYEKSRRISPAEIDSIFTS